MKFAEYIQTPSIDCGYCWAPPYYCHVSRQWLLRLTAIVLQGQLFFNYLLNLKAT